MNKLFTIAAGWVAVSILSGCGSSPKPSGEQPGVVVPSDGHSSDSMAGTSTNDAVLAEIDGIKLSEAQFKPILYKASGLDILLMVIQREMAKAEAGKEGITISPADVDAEKKLTLANVFTSGKEEDYEAALKQFLAQQHVSDTAFSILMEYNAYLRAMVKRAAASNITEESVKAEFNSLYGERVEVRDIALNNLQEVATAQRLLSDPTAPLPFEEVARRMSRLPSAQDGGRLPPFARNSPLYSSVFSEAAFALAPGTVSTDPVQDKGYYHIMKVERRIEPTVVKYEDVKGSVREELIARRAAALMSNKRMELGQHALKSLRIFEPTMRAEFESKKAAANPKPVEKDKLIKELDAIEKNRVSTTRPTSTTTQASPQQ